MGTSFPQTALAIHPVASYHRFEVRSIPAFPRTNMRRGVRHSNQPLASSSLHTSHHSELQRIPAYCHNELMEPFEDRDSICIIWIHLIYAPTGGGKYAV